MQIDIIVFLFADPKMSFSTYLKFILASYWTAEFGRFFRPMALASYWLEYLQIPHQPPVRSDKIGTEIIM
jgi:hypothetical protein